MIDDALDKSYSEFIDEFLNMGHLEEVDEINKSDADVYYLPHYHVVKESKKSITTTKL